MRVIYLCARSCKELHEKERRFGTIWQHLRFRSRDIKLAGAGERLDVLAPCSSLTAFMSLSRRGWRIRCAQNSLMRHTTGWRLGFWRLSMVLSIFSLQCNWETYFAPSQAQQGPLVTAPRFHGRHGAGGSASSECQIPLPKKHEINFPESIPREFRSLPNTPTRTQGRLASTSRR
jgi:hypothetical protein